MRTQRPIWGRDRPRVRNQSALAAAARPAARRDRVAALVAIAPFFSTTARLRGPTCSRSTGSAPAADPVEAGAGRICRLPATAASLAACSRSHSPCSGSPSDSGRRSRSSRSVAILYPFYQTKMFTIPVFGRLARRRDRRRDGRLRHDGRRAEHRRRLRGPARPRLRRLLCEGAYTAAWFTSLQFPHSTFHSARSVSPTLPGIHVTIWLLLPLAG